MQLGLSMAMGARRRPTAFNPVKHFGSDLLWHFGTPDDWWKAFQRALGPELATVTSVAGVAVGGPTLTEYDIGVNVVANKFYLLQAVVSGYTGNNTLGFNTTTRFGSTSNYLSANGICSQQGFAITSGVVRLFTRDANTANFSKVSVREIDISKIQLWQDPAGMLPVTGPGQTWGLLLDAKDGLARGVELVLNGSNLTDTSNWVAQSATIGVSGGALTVTGTGSGARAEQTGRPSGIGKWFEITAHITLGAGVTAAQVNYAKTSDGSTIASATTTVTGPVMIKVQGVESTAQFKCRVLTGTGTVTFSNISVREIPGYHASQAGAPSRPLFTCRYNQLTNSAFTGGGATPTGWTRVVATGTSAPTSTQADGSVVYRQTGFVGERPFFEQILTETLPVGSVKKYRLTVFAVTTGTVQAQHLLNRSGSATTTVQYFKDGVACPSTEPITGPCVLEAVWTVTVAGSIYFRCGPGCSGPMPDAFSVDFGCPDLRLAIDANIGKPYQRVTSATDMDTEGFPFYSWTDGIDDWASTPVIPLGTMGVSAITAVNGVTKLSDSARSIVMELSAAPGTTPGTMVISAPEANGAGSYATYSIGSTPPTIKAEVTGCAAPHKASLLSECDITNDIARLTVNNGAPVMPVADQGTGTFSNQPLYLFRRGGTTLPFGGRWHGSSGVKNIRTDSECRRLKAYYNRNVRAF